MKCGSARCRRKFRDERLPNRQTIHNLVNKLRSARETRNKNISSECLLRSLLAVKHNAVKQFTKLITSLNSKRYLPPGILIHRHNSYAPRSRRCTGRRQPANKGKNLPVYECLLQNIRPVRRKGHIRNGVHSILWRNRQANSLCTL
jgi:hypothetical protein